MDDDACPQVYPEVMKVYEVADYLGIHSLCKATVERLLDANRDSVAKLHGVGEYSLCIDGIGEAANISRIFDYTGFIKGAKRAYELPRIVSVVGNNADRAAGDGDGIRWPHIRFFVRSISDRLTDIDMRQLGAEVSGLAADIRAELELEDARRAQLELEEANLAP